MKRNEIDQNLFEELVKKVISGEMTRKQITKEYHISARKINLMITGLAQTNPELYMEFIRKFPYKPKEIKNIDFVELVKQIIKQDKTIEDLAIKYNVSTRTIRRRIGKMKGSQEIELSSGMTLDELYHLYKRYRAEELSLEDIYIIQTMKVGNIQKAPNSQEPRKKYLTNLIDKYNEYIKQGMSKKEAAKMLGYSFIDIYKKQGELSRIQTEQSYMKNKSDRSQIPNSIRTQNEKMQLFKGSLKFLIEGASQDGVVKNDQTRAIYKICDRTRGVMEK